MLTQKIDWPLGNRIQTMISQKYSPPWPTDSFPARESISVFVVGLHQQRTVRCRYNVLPRFQGIFARAPELCMTIWTLYWCHYPDTETKELRALHNLLALWWQSRDKPSSGHSPPPCAVKGPPWVLRCHSFMVWQSPPRLGKTCKRKGGHSAPGFPIDLSSPDAKSVKKRRLAF